MDTTLLFFGDTHSRFHHVIPCIRKEQSDGRKIGGLVFLGDIVDELKTPLEDLLRTFEDAADAPLRLIFGNHEVDDAMTWQHCQSSTARDLNGRVETLANVRIGGLGGVFQHEIWYPQNGEAEQFFSSHEKYAEALAKPKPRRIHDPQVIAGKLLKHRASIFPEVVERLWEYEADLLVTHEAPGMGLHPNGFHTVAELAQAMRVRHSFHGHQHDCLDSRYAMLAAKMGFTAHGVGYCGVTALDTGDFSTRVVRVGDKDGERLGRNVGPATTSCR